MLSAADTSAFRFHNRMDGINQRTWQNWWEGHNSGVNAVIHDFEYLCLCGLTD